MTTTAAIYPISDYSVDGVFTPGAPHWSRVNSINSVLITLPGNQITHYDLFDYTKPVVPAGAAISAVTFYCNYSAYPGAGGTGGTGVSFRYLGAEYYLNSIPGGGFDGAFATGSVVVADMQPFGHAAPYPWTAAIINDADTMFGVGANSNGLAGKVEIDAWWFTVTYAVTLAVQTDPATNISSGNAQLNGTLTDDGDSPPITVSFEAGLTSACSDWAGGASTGTEGNPFDAIITDLIPGETYYFRAKATDGTTIVYGTVLSFSVAQGPSRPLTRVSSIRHLFQAGENGRPGVYRQEIILGGLSAGWFPTFTGVTPTAPPPTIPDVVSPTFPNTVNLSKSMNEQQLLTQYGLWISDPQHTDMLKRALFGTNFPSFNDWRDWYVNEGAGGIF